MKHTSEGTPHATVLKGVALLTLVFGLLCLFHGVDHDDGVGSLCPGTVLLPLALVLAPDRYPGRRVRSAAAFAPYAAPLRLPDPPPKIRPA